MAENDPQYRCITDTRFALEELYRENPQVYVGADLLLYYEEGDRHKSVAPDVLVALGVPAGNRRSYLIWEEGKPPDVAFEFASEGTWRADLEWKFGLYQGLGVKLELWMRPDGGKMMPYVLRLFNPATGAWLLTPAEEAEARRKAEARVAEEARARVEETRARQEAETRAAELEAELERLRSQLSRGDP